MKIDDHDLSVLSRDAVSYQTACTLLEIGARQLQKLVAAGKLERVGEGHRRRITSDSVCRYGGFSRNSELKRTGTN